VSVRSIVDIDVHSASFDAFQKKWEKFQDQLAKTPSAWSKMSKENEAVSKNFERMAAALMAQNELSHERSEQNKEAVRQTSTLARSWESISNHSKSLYRNVLNISGSLLKWGGLLGGLATGASLFGIDRLASSVSGQRQEAMGLGLSIGQMKSFGINMGRFVDPNQFLGGVNEAVSDISKRGGLRSMGVTDFSSTSATAEATMLALRRIARTTPVEQLGMKVSQFNMGQVGVDEQRLRILKSTGDSEFNQQMLAMRSPVGGMSERTALAWQNFTTNLQTIGGGLFATFASGLVNLSGPLAKLGTSVEHLIAGAMKPGGSLEKGITNLGDWISHLADQIGTEKFQKDFDDLISSLGAAAKGILEFANALPDLADLIHTIAHPLDSIGEHYSNPYHGDKKQTVASYLNDLAVVEKSRGLTPGLLPFLFQRESGGALFPADNKGHVGPFQFDPAVAMQFGASDPRDPWQAKNAATSFVQYLDRKYKGNVPEELAAWNWGECKLSALEKAHPKDWQNFLPEETKKYIAAWDVNVKVQFNNVPGGSVPTATAQLSGG
jgi:hypothetical protein